MKEQQSYIGCSVLAVGGVPAILWVPAIAGIHFLLASLLRLHISSSYSVLGAAGVFAAYSILYLLLAGIPPVAVVTAIAGYMAYGDHPVSGVPP